MNHSHSVQYNNFFFIIVNYNVHYISINLLGFLLLLTFSRTSLWCLPIMGIFAVSSVCHLTCLSHLGPVALSLQLIIGFESGIVVLWDLKSKKADYRYAHDEVGTFPSFIS